MSRRIFRYRLDITDSPVVTMVANAVVLSVGPPRDGTDQLDLWAIVNTDIVTEQDRRFHIVGTGHPMPDYCGRFIGTVPTHGGVYVWHVFEATS